MPRPRPIETTPARDLEGRLFTKTTEEPQFMRPWLGGSLLFYEGREVEFPKLRISAWEVRLSDGAPPAAVGRGWRAHARSWWSLTIERRRSRPRPFHRMQIIRDPLLQSIIGGLDFHYPEWRGAPWKMAAEPREGGPPLPWSSMESWVYFIQIEGGGPIKIGIAQDPLARLAALQTGHPYRLRLLAVKEGGIPEEAALHSRFANIRMEREWFAPAPELLAYMATVTPCHGITAPAQEAA